VSTGLTVRAIADALGGEVRGNDSLIVTQVAPLERATASEIGFVAHAKYRKALETTKAGVLILPKSLAEHAAGTSIVVEDPYLYFARVAQLLNPARQDYHGVHSSAVVLSPLPASVSVGALAFVGEGCSIGDNVIIGPGCVIEAESSVGADTLLHANVVLYAATQVGARCIVHSGAVLGSDGFGFARERDGRWVKIPQIGRVVVGDDVEIGANTAIDRGALDDTVIENGVKLDNLIQIAHNCRVGEHTAMAASSGMAGSATLGKRVMVGGQAGIMGHIEVADDVVVSSRSFMSKSVSEKGVYTATIPAISHNDWLRNAVHIKHLDEMADRIKQLEKKLKELESKQ